MHPTISYELAKARVADLCHAQRDAWVPAGRQARRTPSRPDGDDIRCQALFASSLQPSDAPGADVVGAAISATVEQLGTDGCIGWMAQEFGDHPDAATERMRWARSLLNIR